MESNLLMFSGDTSRHVFSLCTFLFLVKGPRLLGACKDGSPWQARLPWLHIPRSSQWRGLHSQETHMQTYICNTYIHGGPHRCMWTEALSTHMTTKNTGDLILFTSLSKQDEGLLAGKICIQS